MQDDDVTEPLLGPEPLRKYRQQRGSFINLFRKDDGQQCELFRVLYINDTATQIALGVIDASNVFLPMTSNMVYSQYTGGWHLTGTDLADNGIVVLKLRNGDLRYKNRARSVTLHHH
jgi:hypothetical protein